MHICEACGRENYPAGSGPDPEPGQKCYTCAHTLGTPYQPTWCVYWKLYRPGAAPYWEGALPAQGREDAAKVAAIVLQLPDCAGIAIVDPMWVFTRPELWTDLKLPYRSY